jgi:hypothetical protein
VILGDRGLVYVLNLDVCSMLVDACMTTCIHPQSIDLHTSGSRVCSECVVRRWSRGKLTYTRSGWPDGSSDAARRARSRTGCRGV